MSDDQDCAYALGKYGVILLGYLIMAVAFGFMFGVTKALVSHWLSA